MQPQIEKKSLHVINNIETSNTIDTAISFEDSNLDSSVGIQFQYLRSSIPVIDNALADIDMQTLPLILSSHTSCTVSKIKKFKTTTKNYFI